MGLKKGQTNNPKGKPPGAINRLSRDVRQTITDFLNENWPEVEQEFHKLKGRDKVNFFRDLLQYAIPKMQAVAVDMDFNRLTDEQLDMVINKLMEVQK